jgi:hypothetical protein
MTTLDEIESAIQELSPEDLRELRRWFAEFDSDAWDRQIGADIKAGKLDAVAARAQAENAAGGTRKL